MNKSVIWGESFKLTVEAEDAVSATLLIGEISNEIITKTGLFVQGIADVSLAAEDTELTPGDYSWQLNVEFTDGTISKFPDDNCVGCELPTFTVCPAIDMPEVMP